MQSYNYVAADDMAAAALRHENETSNILCKKNSHLHKPKDISQPLTATMVWYSRSRILLVPQLLLFFLLSPAQQPPQLVATITITQRQKKVRVSFITPELSLLSPQLFFFFLPQLFLLTGWVVMRICKCKKHSTAHSSSTLLLFLVLFLLTAGWECWEAILHVHHHDWSC